MTWVVENCLSKYAHFTALNHPYTASLVDQLFANNIFKLHGMPQSIMSDIDPVFMSKFWKEFFQLLGLSFVLSSSNRFLERVGNLPHIVVCNKR